VKHYTTGPETERLLHRAFAVGDAEGFFALNSHPDVVSMTGEPGLPSVDAAREAIASYPDFDTVGYGRWGCVLKDTGALIGFCGLKFLPEFDVVDVGYRFLPDYWGQGFATEAGQASMEFGFETLGLKQIFGFVLPENSASIHVLEKLGMHSDGELLYDGVRALRYVKSNASGAT
jgi:ribosomal-protein-alanine N-acetyltransferase